MAAKQIPTIELWKCRENNKNPSGSEFNITLSDKLVTLSIKSVCQVVEEEITALIFVEPGKCFEAVSSLSSSLGIPLLVLDSSGVIQRILSSSESAPASLSSIINLSPPPGSVGRALSQVIKASSLTRSLVIVYKNEEDLMWLKHFGSELIRNGAVLLEIKTDKRLSEQLSLGVSFILNFSNPEIAWYIHIIYI